MSVRIFYRSPIALAVAMTLASSACAVFAGTATAPSGEASVAAPANGVKQDLMRWSDEGQQAMRAVREARVDLFNGNPQAASEALTLAKASLQVAKVDEPIDVVDVSARTKGKLVADDVFAKRVNLVPIDGRLMLDETLIKEPARKDHVAKARDNLAHGRNNEAARELKLAAVDASLERVLMPLQSTMTQVERASKLIDEKKYYDANLALKAAEDGLRFDTVVVSEAPPAARASATH